MKFNRKKFFDGFKADFDDTLDQGQVTGIEFLLASFEAEPLWSDVRHIAYALATTYHETAGSMRPVEEGYYLGSPTRVKNFQKTLRYYPYFGRGYVQLTWETPKIPNYSKASKALGIDFVKNPVLVMVPANAFKILTLGMHEGWFTGKKLSDFIRGSACDYRSARKIINGMDKAGLIAGYARLFEKILKSSAVSNSAANTDTASESSPIVNEPQEPTVPPNTQEEQTTVETDGEATVTATTTTTTLPGTTPTDTPVQVSTGGALTKWIVGSGGLSALGTLVWGFITANSSAAAIAIICITVLILALVFRSAILDAIRMQTAADPTKYNVK